MKLLKTVILIPLLSVVVGGSVAQDLLFVPAFIAAGAVTRHALPDEVNSPTIYSGAAITTGAGSTVVGGLIAYQAVTLGAGSHIGDALVAGAGATLGADATVSRFITAGDGATLGASAVVGGPVRAGDAINVGASSRVNGDITAGLGIIIGQGVEITGENDVTASTGSVVLGGGSTVYGNFDSQTGIVRAGGEVDDTAPGSFVQSGIIIENQLTPFTERTRVNYQTKIRSAQSALRAMPIDHELGSTIPDSRLYPGVYHATQLVTTASTTLTLDGQNNPNPVAWIFNMDTYLSFGASLTVNLVNAHEDSTVVWNTETYTFVGADSNHIGGIIAGTYVTTGAGTTVCGGIVTGTGGVTLGADNVVGGVNCLGVLTCFVISGGVAEFDPQQCSIPPGEPIVDEDCADDEVMDFYGECHKDVLR